MSGSGLDTHVVELPDSTRTADDAAAIGCEVAEIAKSVVFRTQAFSQSVLVIACGINQFDEKKLKKLVGEPLERANPDFVKERTWFAIGGVPPCRTQGNLADFSGEDLLQYPVVWAAAGTPHAVFSIGPQHLLELSGAKAVDVRRR